MFNRKLAIEYYNLPDNCKSVDGPNNVKSETSG